MADPIALKNTHFRPGSACECPPRFFSFYHLVRGVPQPQCRRSDAFGSRNKIAADLMSRIDQTAFRNTHGDVFVSVDKLDTAVSCVVNANVAVMVDRSDITGRAGDTIVVGTARGGPVNASTHYCDADTGLERRAQDGYIKWDRLHSVLGHRGFVFRRYLKSSNYARVDRNGQKPYVGGDVAPTWIHVAVATDVARTALAPASTVRVLRQLRSEPAMQSTPSATPPIIEPAAQSPSLALATEQAVASATLTIDVKEHRPGYIGARHIYDGIPKEAKRNSTFDNARESVKNKFSEFEEGAWDDDHSVCSTDYVEELLDCLVKDDHALRPRFVVNVQAWTDDGASTSGTQPARCGNDDGIDHSSGNKSADIVLDTWVLEGFEVFSTKALYDATPASMRIRNGDSGWANSRTLAKHALQDEYKVVSGDITPQVCHLDKVVDAMVKGGSQCLSVRTRKLTPTLAPPPSHPTPAQGAVARAQRMNCRQVFDAIRRVQNGPYKGHGSVLDVIKLVTGSDNNYAAQIWRRILLHMNPEADDFEDKATGINLFSKLNSWGNLPKYKFTGQGQQFTPVAPFNELVKIIPYIRSRSADAFKAEIANDFVRKFAGDQTLHAEIDANNATFTREEREDLVRGIPNASSEGVSIQTGPSNTQPRITASPLEDLVTENGTILRVRRRTDAGEGVLWSIDGLESIVIPAFMARRPGCYAGVKGRLITEDGTPYWHVKVGLDNDDIEGRPAEHSSLYPHYKDVWAGAITGVDCLPHILEDKLKVAFRNAPCTFVLEGHKREEFLIPEEVAMSTIQSVTLGVERALSSRVFGTHAASRALAQSGDDEHTVPDAVKWAFDKGCAGAYIFPDTERLSIEKERTLQAEHGAKQAEHNARTVSAKCSLVSDLAAKGFSFEQIQSLTRETGGT